MDTVLSHSNIIKETTLMFHYKRGVLEHSPKPPPSSSFKSFPSFEASNLRDQSLQDVLFCLRQ